MKLSVFTASTPQWTPEEAAANLGQQGWDGIEWRVTDQEAGAEPGFWVGNRATWPLTGLEDSLPAIARITRDAGLQFAAIGGYVSCGDRAGALRLLAATATLGAQRVRLRMPSVRDGNYRELFAATRADLAWAADRAAHHGVKVLVELHHRSIIASSSASLRLVDGLDPAHVGVIHDVGNLIIEGYEDPLAAFEMLGPYLAHVHVKNAVWRPSATAPDGSTLWTDEWATLRAGQADIEAYFRALHEFGYDGWVSAEDFSTAAPLARRTRDNLAYLRAIDARTAD